MIGGTRLMNERNSAEGARKENRLLSEPKYVLFLVGVLLYFTGFVYIYILYDHFGIASLVTERPLYNYFVYSYFVVRDSWEMKLGFTTLLMLLIVNYYVQRRRWLWDGIVAAAMLVLLALSLRNASRTANDIAIGLRSGKYYLPKVRLTFTEDKRQRYETLPILKEALEQDELHLFTQTKEIYYVFYQPEGFEEAPREVPSAFVIEIAKADVFQSQIITRSVAKREERRH